MNSEALVVKTIVKSTPEMVWDCWTDPAHITKWNQASPDWHCPIAHNELYNGGRFLFRMASKNGEQSFDFEGSYKLVKPLEQIDYEISDGRKVTVTFSSSDAGVLVTEQFEPETIHSTDLQKMGWQSILDSFRQYTESRQN